MREGNADSARPTLRAASTGQSTPSSQESRWCLEYTPPNGPDGSRFGYKPERLSDRVQTDPVDPTPPHIFLCHVEHDGAETLSPPRVIGNQAEHCDALLELEVDPDRADDHVICKQDQRVIRGLVLIWPTGIVLAVVFRSLAIVLVENAPLPNIVIAGPIRQSSAGRGARDIEDAHVEGEDCIGPIRVRLVAGSEREDGITGWVARGRSRQTYHRAEPDAGCTHPLAELLRTQCRAQE
jgi:hypothetical protein